MPPRGWAVIGLGRAGLAKARALLGPIAQEEGARLISTCSRRGPLSALAPHLDEGGAVSARSLDEVLNDPLIEAAAICSENAHHAAQARALLSAGRHALVDFPLCATRAEAEGLFQLADARGVVLHQELIGLLTPQHRALLALIEETRSLGDPLGRVLMRQSGGLYRWVLDEAYAGRLGQLCIGRLHQAWALAGPLSLEEVVFEQGGRDLAEGYSLTLSLRGAGGAQVTLVESRAPELPREGSLVAQTLSGALLEPRPGVEGRSPPADLFVEDVRAFYSVARGAPPYVAREVVLAVLGLAEDVSVRVKG
jgi:biliverdin reductase